MAVNLLNQSTMTSSFKKYIALAAFAVAAISAQAQNTVTGYFLDDYTYRFQMNPALGNSRNFIGMPALANLNVGMQGNLHLKDVLYNIDGRTTTFMNPGVDTKTFLKHIDNVNKIGVNAKINILSAGFKAWGGYNTISINARVGANVHLPKSIFSLLKEGVSNQTYDITDVRAHALGYAEVALGHSHQINSEWRVGGTFKFLVGGGQAEARLDEAYLRLGEDSWDIISDGNINVNVKGFTYDQDLNEHTGKQYVSGGKVENTGINGFGAAFDLGATYKPNFCPGLELSAAFLDLGFINWDNNMLASTNGRQEVMTDRYTFNADSDAPNSFSNEWKKLRDDFSAIYQLNPMGDTGSKVRALHTTMNIGAHYVVQTDKRLSFGLLNTTCIAGPYTWTSFRLSGNFAPWKALNIAASVAEGTYGFDFGWMINLHVTGFNFFVGMDHTLGKLAKQGVPISSNGGVNLGMNFLF